MCIHTYIGGHSLKLLPDANKGPCRPLFCMYVCMYIITHTHTHTHTHTSRTHTFFHILFLLLRRRINFRHCQRSLHPSPASITPAWSTSEGLGRREDLLQRNATRCHVHLHKPVICKIWCVYVCVCLCMCVCVCARACACAACIILMYTHTRTHSYNIICVGIHIYCVCIHTHTTRARTLRIPTVPV